MGLVRPRFGRLSLPEAEALLKGLKEVNVVQFSGGVPSVSRALQTGRLRYVRRDPREHWRTAREIWQFGGGDCEDLAAAVAAELSLKGLPAIPVIRPVRPGLAHALVMVEGRLIDPSVTGGMRRA